MKIKTTIFLLSLTIIYFTSLVVWQDNKQCEYKGHEEPVFDIIEVNDKTTFTAYTLSVDETDETPCIGAGNNNLCELKPILAKDNIRICASRDLPLDTLIYIEGFGECVIKDRMSKKYLNTGRIDILFDNKIDAINFGIKKLNYTIIK